MAKIYRDFKSNHNLARDGLISIKNDVFITDVLYKKKLCLRKCRVKARELMQSFLIKMPETVTVTAVTKATLGIITQRG